MKVLVTGANGYIGRHVVKELLDKGNEVIACDLRVSDIDKRATKVEFDIFNLPKHSIYESFERPDVCIHMAWRNGFNHNAPSQIGDLSAHYTFLTRIIDEGLKQLAVMGTMHEIGYWEGCIGENTPCNPISMYGIAKDALRRALTIYCKQHNVVLQWLRCFYILGDDINNNSIFTKILTSARDGNKTFPFTTGENQYDFINIDELSKMIVAASTQKEISGIINCCNGKPVSLAQTVEKFIKDHGIEMTLEYGVYPNRPYDSPCIYGDAKKIYKIINKPIYG